MSVWIATRVIVYYSKLIIMLGTETSQKPISELSPQTIVMQVWKHGEVHFSFLLSKKKQQLAHATAGQLVVGDSL